MRGTPTSACLLTFFHAASLSLTRRIPTSSSGTSTTMNAVKDAATAVEERLHLGSHTVDVVRTGENETVTGQEFRLYRLEFVIQVTFA